MWSYLYFTKKKYSQVFVCYMQYPREDCGVVLEVAPRLKIIEMNEKMEIESLHRSLSQLDYEMIREEERHFLAFCLLLVFCLLKAVKVGSLCYIIFHFLNFLASTRQCENAECTQYTTSNNETNRGTSTLYTDCKG